MSPAAKDGDGDCDGVIGMATVMVMAMEMVGSEDEMVGSDDDGRDGDDDNDSDGDGNYCHWDGNGNGNGDGDGDVLTNEPVPPATSIIFGFLCVCNCKRLTNSCFHIR